MILVQSRGVCTGVDISKWGGVAPLWYDVLQQHERQPLHAMMGGGDQVIIASGLIH